MFFQLEECERLVELVNSLIGEGKVLDRGRRRCCWRIYLQTIFNSHFERYLLLLIPVSVPRSPDFKSLEKSWFFFFLQPRIEEVVT